MFSVVLERTSTKSERGRCLNLHALKHNKLCCVHALTHTYSHTESETEMFSLFDALFCHFHLCSRAMPFTSCLSLIQNHTGSPSLSELISLLQCFIRFLSPFFFFFCTVCHLPLFDPSFVPALLFVAPLPPAHISTVHSPLFLTAILPSVL